MKHNIYLYILVITVVTYLIRVLPLTLIRREIRNRFLRSFLYYVPYAVSYTHLDVYKRQLYGLRLPAGRPAAWLLPAPPGGCLDLKETMEAQQ